MDDKKWLKEALDKLDNKVDRLDQRLDEISERHITNSASLNEHIYRTELNEENISMLREEFKPIQKHIIMINGILKGIGFLAILIGMVEGVVKVLEFFR
jgi:predicted nuclease with TOPRIM domain